MSSTLRTLLLQRGGPECIWTGHCGVPLQGLPLCRDKYLWHQCWSYAISGKRHLYCKSQWRENAFMSTRLGILALNGVLFSPLFFAFSSSDSSGSFRWVLVRALRWATTYGLHASCCIVCVKILGLSQHSTPSHWRTGTVLAATRMSAPRRWGKRTDWCEWTVYLKLTTTVTQDWFRTDYCTK